MGPMANPDYRNFELGKVARVLYPFRGLGGAHFFIALVWVQFTPKTSDKKSIALIPGFFPNIERRYHSHSGCYRDGGSPLAPQQRRFDGLPHEPGDALDAESIGWLLCHP